MPSPKRISKSAMQRLLKSEFFRHLCDAVTAWDYYVAQNDRGSAFAMQSRWETGQEALLLLTGRTYGISRTDEHIAIVNAQDFNDILFTHSRATIC